MEQNFEQICQEIESKLVNNADLIELLVRHFNKDEINDDELRIMQSSLSIILDIQKDVFDKFSLLADRVRKVG